MLAVGGQAALGEHRGRDPVPLWREVHSELWREKADVFDGQGVTGKLANATPPFCNTDESVYGFKPRSYADSDDAMGDNLRSLFPMQMRT